MLIEVRREALEPCAYGAMYVDGDYFSYSLERPWLDNMPRVSAIPEGTYPITYTYSPKFKRKMIRLQNVPARAGILIHGANYWKELEGCIAVAENRYGIERITKSKVKQLEAMVQAALKRGEAVQIKISNPIPA